MIAGGIIRKPDPQFGFPTRLGGEPRPPISGFDLKGERAVARVWACVSVSKSADQGLEIGRGDFPTVKVMLGLDYAVSVAVSRLEGTGTSSPGLALLFHRTGPTSEFLNLALLLEREW